MEMKEIEKPIKDFANSICEKYGKLIKCIVKFGESTGLMKGTEVLVVIDDITEPIPKDEIEKIEEDLDRIAEEISEELVIISITLSEFWDNVRRGEPIIYHSIKTGIPIYDVGFFIPLQHLWKKGKIPFTHEQIQRLKDVPARNLGRARIVKMFILAEDCFGAMFSSLQAVLMFMNIEALTPVEAYEALREHLVKQKLVEPEFAEYFKEIMEIRNKIVNGELKEVSGGLIDEWIQRAKKFSIKMLTLLSALEIRKRELIVNRTYEVLNKAVIKALKEIQALPEDPEKVQEVFDEMFVKRGLIGEDYYALWKKVTDMKKLVDENKIIEIPNEDVYQAREDVRKLLRKLTRAVRKIRNLHSIKSEAKTLKAY